MTGARRKERRATALIARVVALIALAGALVATPARADLEDDAARLARLWSSSGARVVRKAPIFAEHGRIKVVLVEAPPAPPGSGAGGCTTIAFLAPRVVDFTLRTELGEAGQGQAAMTELLQQLRGDNPEDDRRIRGVAGAAVIARCGPEREQLQHVVLDVTSPRAAFEVVVASSSGPVDKIEAVFPERNFGPMAPRGDPGRPIEPGPLADRIARAERRARIEGAQRVVPVEMRASLTGTGQLAVKLSEGCHRLDVMAEVPTVLPRRATDIDAEAREAETGRLLDRDRADAPDARLDLCLGEAGVVDVPFLGASGAVRVVLSDAQWPVPRFVPAQFGARARGGFAAALHRRRAPDPRAEPVAQAVGVQGETPVPIAVEPGRCYFAAAALVRGDLRSLRLSAEIGDRASRDDASEHGESAGVAFCSTTEETATLRVMARGSTPWWAVAVWPMD